MKFSYDPSIDDLFMYNPNSKSKGSIEIGDIILDFNTKKELVGMQILNASKFVEDLVDKNKVKDFFLTLKECSFEVKSQKNWLLIKLKLISKSLEIMPTITLPKITNSSQAIK